MEIEKQQRIKQVSDYLSSIGVKKQQIATDLGVSAAYASDLFNGKKSIGEKLSKKLQEMYDISPAWLIFGEGDMLCSTQNVDTNNAPLFQNNGNGGNGVTQNSGVPSGTIEKLLAEMKEQRISFEAEKKRLLDIIETLIKNK